MKIDYVSTSMEKNDFVALFSGCGNMPGQQSQKFNRLLAEGLAANGVQVNACTGRPVTRQNCGKVFLPGAKTFKNENLVYSYGSVLNLPVVKNLWQMASAYFSVCRDARKGDCAVVCDVLNASVAIGASLAAKQHKIPCVGIVTDLPHLLVTTSRKTGVGLADWIMESCTGYILLAEAMNEKINPTGKPYAVIEGLCDTGMQQMEKQPRDAGVKKCMYAGFLDARYGVKAMVDGFVRASIPDAELHVYGSGPYGEELQEVARQHPSVVFHGNVLNDEVVAAELEADLLINPRPTHEEFTKYSFPSKNLEYMVSGTAVLTTALPGMPGEYYDYVYIARDETAQGFCEKLKQLLSLPREELDAMGAAARKFVLAEKNNTIQSRKILDVIGRCR